MEPLINQLKKSNSILIASHENPDGDAIGALLALGLALESLGKKVTLYNESPIPAVYRFLPSVRKITRKVGDPGCFDTAIVLDCGGMHRIGNAAVIVGKVPAIVNIDHHVTNSNFGDYHIIDTDACATAEIIYRLIREMGIALTKKMAVSIYTGILTDTGSFRFSNTNRASFSICEEMVALGVNPSLVASHVYGTYSLGRIKLLNLALDSIEISESGKISIMTLTQDMMDETGTNAEDADGLINYARRIEDVKVAALIHELEKTQKSILTPKNYHVSLRSDGSVDVAAIASMFGGGGHSSAAGFSIRSTIPEIKTKIIELSERFTQLCDVN